MTGVLAEISKISQKELDILLKSFHIDIYGGGVVAVEGHRGVAEFSDKLIILRLKGGKLCVEGEGLKLKQLTKNEAVVEGKITKIEVENEQGDI